QVAQRDDARQPFVLVENDQSADLVFSHQLGRFGDGLILEDVVNGRCHNVLNASLLRIQPLSNCSDGDVAIGDHPLEAIILAANGQGPHVQVFHLLGSRYETLPGLDAFDAARHDLFHLHGGPPQAHGPENTLHALGLKFSSTRSGCYAWLTTGTSPWIQELTKQKKCRRWIEATRW